MTKLQKWIIGITGTIAVVLSGWIFWYISQTELSPQLGTLFNVLLTVFSIVVSLIVSHYYFDASRQQTIKEIKEDYKRNNKLYSQKAAEKVDNLSNELTKLSIYLQQSMDNIESDNPATSLLVQEEKIRSAIHIVETLKSINDRSLSDWLGVLDEEDIEEQAELREEQREERESDFKSILDNYKILATENSKINFTIDAKEDNEDLSNVHTDLSELNKKIDKLATSIIGTPVRTRKASVEKELVKLPCPNCSAIITYRQRPSATSVKGMKCSNCQAKLVARWSQYDGFTLYVKPVNYTVEESPKIISEEIIKKVEKELPEQPWPKGTSQTISKKLNVSPSDMKRAIDTLIERGVFKVQIDGQLYDKQPEKVEKEKLIEEVSIQ